LFITALEDHSRPTDFIIYCIYFISRPY